MFERIEAKARELQTAKRGRYKALDALHVASDDFIGKVKEKLGRYNYDRLRPDLRVALSQFAREDEYLCAHVGLGDTSYSPERLVAAAKALAAEL